MELRNDIQFHAGWDDAEAGIYSDISEMIQSAYNRVGPINERHSNWLRSTEEPWRSIAAAFE